MSTRWAVNSAPKRPKRKRPDPVADETHTKDSMNRMYRWTRHIYDASRKYFLLGRDNLIENLDARPGQHICEVGCGTARNLAKLASAYPETHFYGLDASDVMLETARRKLARADLASKIHLAQGYAQSFDPVTAFELTKPLDKIVFSYALSIIPPWKEAIDHALELLPLGGEIHIVDFGDAKDLPGWFKNLLFWWLSLFHVHYKPEILECLKQMETDGKGTLETIHLHKGYAYYTVFTKA